MNLERRRGVLGSHGGNLIQPKPYANSVRPVLRNNEGYRNWDDAANKAGFTTGSLITAQLKIFKGNKIRAPPTGEYINPNEFEFLFCR